MSGSVPEAAAAVRGRRSALLTQDLPDPDELSSAEWERVAEWVGDLPLALDLLNRVLALNALPLRELIRVSEGQHITSELDRLSEALRGQVPESARHGISEALILSFEKLDPETRKAACLLAMLAPAPIPKELVAAFGTKISNPKTRSALVSRHFIVAGSDGMFGSMHSVIADFIRTVAQADSEANMQTACAAVSQVFVDEAKRAKAPALIGACGVHAEWLFQFRSLETPVDCEGLSDLSGLILAVANLRKAHGDYPGARVLEENVLRVTQPILGEGHPTVLTAMSNLAITMTDQGELEKARSLAEQVVSEGRALRDQEHPAVLRYTGVLANILYRMHDFSGAQEIQQKVLDTSRHLLGEEHPDTLLAMDNLASTLLERHDFIGAGRLQETALETMRRVIGDDHPDTLLAMDNLAVRLCRQGLLTEARAVQEKALCSIRQVLGEKHPDTLTLMSNLANTLSAQDVLEEAQKLQEKVLEARRRVLGEEHPATSWIMEHLATTLAKAGNLTAARELHVRVLDSRRRLLGPEHPDTLTGMSNLADTLTFENELSGARELLLEVLAARRRVLGPSHSDTVNTMRQLAVILWLHDDLTGARSMLAEAAKYGGEVAGLEQLIGSPSALGQLRLRLKQKR